MKSERLYVKRLWTALAESLEHCAGIRKLLISNPAYTVLFSFLLLAHTGFIFYLAHIVSLLNFCAQRFFFYFFLLFVIILVVILSLLSW